MHKIHELSNLLANQIAAGEVIERPASVVKELVENAIDAEATQIDIIVEDAGQSLIRVVDNGGGIEPEDVPLAFTRHATSKINSRHDLFNILSLGFRGEALPSIAAISDVTLNTTTQVASTGVMYHIKGGKQVSQTPANGRIGTVITVRDLFYNTPARLKYLKRPKTELAKIVDILNRLALSYTKIAFSLTSDGKSLLKTTGNGHLQQVIAAIYGRDVAQKMIDIQGENDDFNVSGYVSLPELTRGSREYLTVLVNHRFVKNFAVSNAIIKGYGSKLMIGRFPMGVINIDTDPLLIDVNVHPQKSEIRLTKEAELSELLITTIKQRLSQENLIPDAYDNLYGSTSVKRKDDQHDTHTTSQSVPSIAPTTKAPWTVNSSTPEHVESLEATASAVQEETNTIMINHKGDLNHDTVLAFEQKYATEPFVTAFPETEPSSHQVVTENKVDYQTTLIPNSSVSKSEQVDLDILKNEKTGFPELTYIGQMSGTFLFAQSQDGLYLIDQHAAQERVKYEYYRQAIGEVGQDKQRLLVPIVIEYSASDMLRIADHEDSLAQVGLKLEPFGPTSVVVREHPIWFMKGQEEATIKEMVDWILRDGHLTVAEFREKTAIMMSCKRSIRANLYIDDAQARALINDLSQAENPYNCPHGRPVLVTFSLNEMEKMFKRIQDSHEKWASYDNHPY